MDLGSALMAILISLGVKLGVLVIGARLLLRLYRARTHRPGKLWLLLPQRDEPEVKVLWWSLVLFYLSELTCGVEVYVLFQSNRWLSSFHAFASAGGMALFALGLYLMLDRRMVHYGQKRCAINAICKGCTIEKPEGCRFTTVATLLATFVALAAVYPWFVSTDRLVANTSAYALPFESWNTWYDQTVVPWLMANVSAYDPTGEAYYIPSMVLEVEFKVLPLIAFVAATASIFMLRTRREVLGIKVAALAFGFLSYTYFELIVYKTTDDVILGSLGHEVAEFWFLVAAAEFLHASFGPREPESAKA